MNSDFILKKSGSHDEGNGTRQKVKLPDLSFNIITHFRYRIVGQLSGSSMDQASAGICNWGTSCPEDQSTRQNVRRNLSFLDDCT